MEIPAKEAVKLINGNNVTVIDVREADEFEYGSLPNSISFPMSQFNSEILDIVNRESRVLVVCRGGFRSLECAKKLKDLGYEDACSVAGGLKELNKFLGEKIDVK